MGMLQSLQAGASRLVEAFKRPKPKDRGNQGVALFDAILARGTAEYTRQWSANRVNLVQNYRHWVYVAVNTIASTCSEATFQVAKKSKIVPESDPDKRYRKMLSHRALWAKTLTNMRQGDEYEPVPNHPIVELYDNPNSPDVSSSLTYRLFMFLELSGIAYEWMVPDSFQMPRESWIIPSHWVWKMYRQGKWWYDVRPLDTAVTMFTLPEEQIIEYCNPSPITVFDGYSTQTAIAEWIDTSHSLDVARLQGFRNGVTPTLALESAKECVMDIPTMDRIQQDFIARFAGVRNTGRPMVLSPGTTVKELMGISSKEMGFVDSAPQMRDWVLGGYGVPYSAAGQMGGATYENYDESMEAYNSRINRKLRYVARVRTEKIIQPNWGKEYVFLFDNVQHNSPRQTAEMVKTLDWTLTPDEKRGCYGFPPLEDGTGDKIYVPAGLMPLDRIDEATDFALTQPEITTDDEGLPDEKPSRNSQAEAEEEKPANRRSAAAERFKLPKAVKPVAYCGNGRQ